MLTELIEFIQTHGQKAYPNWTDAQLRNHLVAAFAYSQIQFALTDDHTSIVGVCTWIFNHKQKSVYIVGLVGNKDFVILMRNRWRAEYPYYTVTFERRNGFRKYSGKSQAKV